MKVLKSLEITKDGKTSKVEFLKESDEEILVYIDGFEEGHLLLEKNFDDSESLAGWVLYLPYFMGKNWADGTVYDTDLKEALNEVIDDMETL